MSEVEKRESKELVDAMLAKIHKLGGIEEMLKKHGVSARLKLSDAWVTQPLGRLAEVLALAEREGREPRPDEVFSPTRPPSEPSPTKRERGPDRADLSNLLEAFGPDFFDFFGFFGFFADAAPETLSAASRRTAPNDSKRAKGYALYNPQKKTKVLLAQVQRILEEYRDSLPLTARQIFYRLVGAYGYPKDENAYERLTDKLVRARRAGLIPFEHIRDDGASVMMGRYYASEEEFYLHVRQLGENFKRDKLADQELDIRVYCEAAGMMPQLHNMTKEYSIGVYSSSGYDSLTFKYDLAKDIKEAFTYRGRKTVILHLGDYDPSGENIFDVIEEDVHEFLRLDVRSKPPEEVAIFERVALTPDHIEEYGLPTAPPKGTDSRTKKFSGQTCQLESLPPDQLARELEIAIEAHLDLSILQTAYKLEEIQRRKIVRALPAGGQGKESV